MSRAPDWATSNGDVWARRWRDAEQALSGLNVELDAAIAATAPAGSFRALDIGCGAGSTSMALAACRPDAAIIACDLSPSLAAIARERTEAVPSVEVVLGDAEAVAASKGPFDLFYSRHGVMFFEDPAKAFRSFAQAARPGAALVFSCFQDWSANSWASELASAAAGAPLPPPGREPSGFAFAQPDYVREILASAGWSEARAEAVPFRYVAGSGERAVNDAMSFLGDIGPASRVVRSMPEAERGSAIERMRKVIERHFDGRCVTFDAAAWIWFAKMIRAAA